MLSIFICEDDQKQRELLEMIVFDYLDDKSKKGHGFDLTLSTDNPSKILGYLERHPNTNGIYILDVNLQHEMNGIVLASKIREIDHAGKILFVTTHAELSHLTFTYRIEALDYILKGEFGVIASKIGECLDVAYRRQNNESLKKECFEIKTGNGLRQIPLDELMFFESHSSVSHKLILHTKSKRIEFYGSLRDVAEANPAFFRCHQSYVVNVHNIREIDKVEEKIKMANGEFASVTRKKLTALMNAWQRQVV